MRYMLQSILVVGLVVVQLSSAWAGIFTKKDPRIELPSAVFEQADGVAAALQKGKATKKYQPEAIALETIAQLLWAGQGVINKKTGERTAPSVMNFHMLDLYLLTESTPNLAAGLYKYHSHKHQLSLVQAGEVKKQLEKVLGYGEVKQAPVCIVLVGLRVRTPKPEWFYLEAGHAAQNIILQATALELGTKAMTGFKEKKVREVLQLSEKEFPIYVMPIGKAKKK
jgi:SagB-type dehydrogenase family enzyme